MVVCMSRRICIDLYRELTHLRPGWHADDDGKGAIKVVMTGSASDPLDWQPTSGTRPAGRSSPSGSGTPTTRCVSCSCGTCG